MKCGPFSTNLLMAAWSLLSHQPGVNLEPGELSTRHLLTTLIIATEMDRFLLSKRLCFAFEHGDLGGGGGRETSKKLGALGPQEKEEFIYSAFSPKEWEALLKH